MTAAHASATSDAPSPTARRRGLRLPGSRAGTAGLMVLVLIGALLAVQVGRQVYANWEIGQRAAKINARIAAVEAENQRLRDELEYLRSDAYISAEARRLTNVGSTGEQVLIIPAGAEAPPPETEAATEPMPPLLEQWLRLFFVPGS